MKTHQANVLSRVVFLDRDTRGKKDKENKKKNFKKTTRVFPKK